MKKLAIIVFGLALVSCGSKFDKETIARTIADDSKVKAAGVSSVSCIQENDTHFKCISSGARITYYFEVTCDSSSGDCVWRSVR